MFILGLLGPLYSVIFLFGRSQMRKLTSSPSSFLKIYQRLFYRRVLTSQTIYVVFILLEKLFHGIFLQVSLRNFKLKIFFIFEFFSIFYRSFNSSYQPAKKGLGLHCVGHRNGRCSRRTFRNIHLRRR